MSRSGRRGRYFVFRFSAVAVYDTAYFDMFIAAAFDPVGVGIGIVFSQGPEEFDGRIGPKIFVDLIRGRAECFDRPDFGRIIAVFPFLGAFLAGAQQEMQEAILAAVGRIAGSRIIRIIFRGFFSVRKNSSINNNLVLLSF